MRSLLPLVLGLLALACGGDADSEPDADDGSDPPDAAESDPDAHPADAGDDGDAVECEGDGDCDDEISCTVGACSEDGECIFDPDDELCDDENECTVNTCDAETGCEAEPVPDDEPCAEGAGTCQGGQCVEGEAGTAAYRYSALELQHPHIIAQEDGVGICDDVTFDDLEVFGETVAEGLNPTLEGLIEDLEFNLVSVLDELQQEEGFASGATVFDAECENEDDTSCEPSDQGELAAADYSVQTSGSCLDNIPGIFAGEWPDGRLSNPNTPAAGDDGCFATEPTDVTLEIEIEGEPIELPLIDGQIAAEFAGDPAGALHDGAVIGFLTQETADDIDIEFETDFGTFTFNLGEDLLPADGDGVQGCEPRTHCDGPDARVVHEGECGWWFAFNYEGERLADPEPFE